MLSPTRDAKRSACASKSPAAAKTNMVTSNRDRRSRTPLTSGFLTVSAQAISPFQAQDKQRSEPETGPMPSPGLTHCVEPEAQLQKEGSTQSSEPPIETTSTSRQSTLPANRPRMRMRPPERPKSDGPQFRLLPGAREAERATKHGRNREPRHVLAGRRASHRSHWRSRPHRNRWGIPRRASAVERPPAPASGTGARQPRFRLQTHIRWTSFFVLLRRAAQQSSQPFSCSK